MYSVYDVIIDLRSDSKTFLQYFGIELSASNKKMILAAGILRFSFGFFVALCRHDDIRCWLMPFFSGRMALIIARTTTLITVLIMGILLLCQADCHDQNSSIKRRASTKILTLAACILHCFFCFCVSMFLLFMMFDVDQCHSFQERWKYFSVKLKPTAIPF